ncbi:hypothetical protein ALC57_15336, partial [Trachymyrmex cornetzi]
NSGEMPGKIVCPREESLVYKVFDSGLKQSLFLPGLSALSTKLITVQRALFCLVCLFLPTAHPTSFSPQTFCRMACFTAGTAGLLRLRPVCRRRARSALLRFVSIVVATAAASRWRGCARFRITIRYSDSELKAQLLNNGMSRDVLYVSRLYRTKCYGVSPTIRGRSPLNEKAHRRGCPSASESMRRCRCRRRGVGESRVGGGVPSTAGKGYGRLQGAPAAHVSRGGAAWRDCATTGATANALSSRSCAGTCVHTDSAVLTDGRYIRSHKISPCHATLCAAPHRATPCHATPRRAAAHDRHNTYTPPTYCRAHTLVLVLSTRFLCLRGHLFPFQIPGTNKPRGPRQCGVCGHRWMDAAPVSTSQASEIGADAAAEEEARKKSSRKREGEREREKERGKSVGEERKKGMWNQWERKRSVNGQRVNHEIANNRRTATPAGAKQWRRRPEGCSGRKFQLTLWRPRCKLRRGQRRVGRGQQGRSKGAATAAAAITIGGIGVTAASVVVSESTVVEVIVVVVVAAVTVAVAVVVSEFRGG